ncbi:MAG: DUF362 domain-containing protein [bacterium]|nr:DUF362 domain-containing protein [bacterium]
MAGCTNPQGQTSRNGGQTGHFLWRWFTVNSVLTGILSLAWLVFRSGPKPSRLTYPCQQAAYSTASLALAAPVVAVLITARKKVAASLRTRAGLTAMALVIIAPLCVWGARTHLATERAILLSPPADYNATVFRVTDCPEDPIGDSFPGLDNLLFLMGRNGLKFYQTAAVTNLAGPDGIIAANDVVIVKINYQWTGRGGTNTDLLRGLIRTILDHPDGFAGEVVVCENTQFAPSNHFDRPGGNNSQDRTQSPLDIVRDFHDRGYPVFAYDWTVLRPRAVDEFSQGDDSQGYVVYDLDPDANGRVSYPKFIPASGTRISLRDGIWDPVTRTYDRNRLKFINVPVLKPHGAVYGATACVKNYMGVVTDVLNTYSHDATRSGLMGALIREIGLADLNILDCIWINPNPSSGPSVGYSTRTDQLVASVDPVAADIWAVTNILVPAFIDYGFPPPWSSPDATPNDPSSDFRVYLDNSMNEILKGGIPVTNDLNRIRAISWDGTSQLPRTPQRVTPRRARPRPLVRSGAAAPS